MARKQRVGSDSERYPSEFLDIAMYKEDGAEGAQRQEDEDCE